MSIRVSGVATAAFGVLSQLLGCKGSSPTPASHDHTVVPYGVVREWRIPAGGYGRIIVIDTAYRNESAMRQLGAQLRDEARRLRMMAVQVYDNVRAAELNRRAMSEDLPRDSVAFHDRHNIGQYLKNGNTGYNEWLITLNGWMDDSIIRVQY